MEDNKRACFAVVAATLVNKKRYNGVYDFNQSRHIAVSSSNVDRKSPDFYDHNRGGAITGNDCGMYDHPSTSHVSIHVSNKRVDCFDFETNSHLNYCVNGNSVSAYDFQTSSHYNYSVG